MGVVLNIPDDILETIKLPRNQIAKELQKELGFLIYDRGLASIGPARKLAGLTKWEFIEGLAQRGILRHYEDKELDEDITYAKSSK